MGIHSGYHRLPLREAGCCAPGEQVQAQQIASVKAFVAPPITCAVWTALRGRITAQGST